MEKSNIFSIFLNESTSNQKRFIISLALIYAFCSSGIIGLPLWFQEPPHLLCSENENQTPCSEDYVCQNSLGFAIDTALSPSTLTTELGLFCDRKLIKRLLLSMVFFGGFTGCLVNFLVSIKSEWRKNVLAGLGIVFSIANFMITLSPHSEIIVGLSLATMSFTCMIGNSYGFIIINEYFSGNLAKSATIIMTLCWGTFGICFGFFAWVIHSNWRILFLTMGTLVFLDAVYLLSFKPEHGVKEGLSKAPRNVLDFLRDITKIPQIRKNYLIYVFIWTATSITYNDILLELGTLGGNLYINMMMVSGVEIFASFGASVVSLKFSISTSLRHICTVLIMLFAMFIFSPVATSEKKSLNLYTIFLLICMLIGKALSETICNLTYVYAPKVMTDKFTPYYMVSVRLFSRICLLFLPHVNYFFRFLDLHAFVFLAFVWAFARFLQSFTKEVQPEGIEDLLNEFKINVVSRMSVITGSSMIHHAPEELLRNLHVEGGNLHDIKKSRVHHQSLVHGHPLMLMERRHLYSMDEGLLGGGNKDTN